MITIIDYGLGNIYSIESALSYLGCDYKYTDSESDIFSSSHIILPGVGMFKRAMEILHEKKLVTVIQKAVYDRGIPLLGICLGMQLLAKSSTEGGFTEGLGFIDGKVEKFQLIDEKMKIPHVGFNNVRATDNTVLLNGLPYSDFYFTHSYRLLCEDHSATGFCVNGEEFVACVEKNNIFGTQFHPEKSQANGLKLFINFIGL